MAEFVRLIGLHNRTAGLVAPGDLDELWERHVADSLTLLLFESIPAGTRVLDFGSGGGFPGFVLALARLKATFVLAESILKKAAFLQTAARLLAAENVKVHADRAEKISEQFDIVTLRATGPLTRTLHQSLKLLTPAGKIALWAGKSFFERADYWHAFLQKRGAKMEIQPYPEGWMPERELFMAFISRGNG